MAVKDTKAILEKHMSDPLKVCRYFLKYFPDADEKSLYKYFLQFGMYTNHSKMEDNLHQLEKEDVWYKVDDLLMLYQEKWNGPDIPVFIMPHRHQTRFSMGHNKSGLAFNDKLFLFLSPGIEQEQLESLFIHEYHHVCRLNKQRKQMNEYTLLESCVMEGLAEFTVQTIMGEECVAPWMKRYSESFLRSFWKKHLDGNRNVKKSEKLHDWIMYGNSKYPYMGGYCMGFYIVELFAEKKTFTIPESFSLPAIDIAEVFVSEHLY